MANILPRKSQILMKRNACVFFESSTVIYSFTVGINHKNKVQEAILAAHTGQLGGPLADLAPLIGTVLGIYDTPIDFDIVKGKGTIRVGEVVTAEMQPVTDAQGRPTKLVDTVFSTIPGSPAYVGKATSFVVNQPEHNLAWSFNGRNAVLGDFLFAG